MKTTKRNARRMWGYKKGGKKMKYEKLLEKLHELLDWCLYTNNREETIIVVNQIIKVKLIRDVLEGFIIEQGKGEIYIS